MTDRIAKILAERRLLWETILAPALANPEGWLLEHGDDRTFVDLMSPEEQKVLDLALSVMGGSVEYEDLQENEIALLRKYKWDFCDMPDD